MGKMINNKTTRQIKSIKPNFVSPLTWEQVLLLRPGDKVRCIGHNPNYAFYHEYTRLIIPGNIYTISNLSSREQLDNNGRIYKPPVIGFSLEWYEILHIAQDFTYFSLVK
jgi:hypothetical protein